MEFNKLVFAGLSIGCLAAAGGGAYLAVRHNQPPQALDVPAGASSAPVSAPAAPAGASQPVTESEGVITPQAPAAPPAPAAPVQAAPRVAAPTTSRRAANNPGTAGAGSREPGVEEPVPGYGNRPAPRTVGTRPAHCNTAWHPRHLRHPSAPGSSMWETRAPVQASTPEYKDPEPPPPPPPPAPEFVDLTVPSDAVLGLQIERTVSSELARVEDKVEARVTRDVRVDGRIAIPAGSTVRGSVTEVDRGGRMKGKARLAIRFHTIVLADGTQLAFKSDPVVREGASPGGESAAKVGGAAIGGAILGAILGGGRGAAIGGAVGAAGGTAAAMTNDRNPATLAAGTTVTVRSQAPVTVTVQKE